MRIVNETGWSTEDLRKITAEVARRELDPYQREGLVITFKPGRTASRVSGWCYLGIVKGRDAARWNKGRHGLLRLTLPPTTKPGEIVSVGKLRWKRGREPYKLDTRRLAYVLAHEMAHARGLDHAHMKGGHYWRGEALPYYAYAETFTVSPAPKRIVDRKAVATSALDHARRMVAKWETRCKRDATALKGWRRRVAARQRALDLKLAASPQPCPVSPTATAEPPQTASTASTSGSPSGGQTATSPAEIQNEQQKEHSTP